MRTNQRGWDRKRSEKLRAAMTDAEIEALFERSKSDLDSLSIDEVGVLFLITRDRIRLIEARLKPDDGKKQRRR
jgi:DNA-directed RNA polymerase sigma subunit (sigma70/sigma32)